MITEIALGEEIPSFLTEEYRIAQRICNKFFNRNMQEFLANSDENNFTKIRVSLWRFDFEVYYFYIRKDRIALPTFRTDIEEFLPFINRVRLDYQNIHDNSRQDIIFIENLDEWLC